MAITENTFKRGINKGAKTIVYIGKVLIPVYFLVTFLKYTPIMKYIADFFKPIMHIVGLPGEAAVPFVMGNMIHLYAAIGALSALELTAKEITIISVMLCFSHSLFLETAICKKVGVSAWMIIVLRQTLAILSGIILNIII